MRLDDYLSTVGVIKRRTVAKDLASSGMISANGRIVKAAYNISLGDIITIKGSKGETLEVLEIPSGSVAKDDREKYYRVLK